VKLRSSEEESPVSQTSAIGLAAPGIVPVPAKWKGKMSTVRSGRKKARGRASASLGGGRVSAESAGEGERGEAARAGGEVLGGVDEVVATVEQAALGGDVRGKGSGRATIACESETMASSGTDDEAHEQGEDGWTGEEPGFWG
jgi:hypothetical protein